MLDQGPCIQQVDPQSRARLEDVSHHIDLLWKRLFQLTHLKKECCWTNLPSFSNSNISYFSCDFKFCFSKSNPPWKHSPPPKTSLIFLKIRTKAVLLCCLFVSPWNYYCGFGKQNWKKLNCLQVTSKSNRKQNSP